MLQHNNSISVVSHLRSRERLLLSKRPRRSLGEHLLNLALDFGPDMQIKVARATLKQDDVAPSKFAFLGGRTYTASYRTTIRNMHKDKREVHVFERVPLSVQETVKVTRTEDTTPGSTEAPDLRGVYLWKLDVAPNEQKDVVSGFKVEYPDKQKLNIQP